MSKSKPNIKDTQMAKDNQQKYVTTETKHKDTQTAKDNQQKYVTTETKHK